MNRHLRPVFLLLLLLLAFLALPTLFLPLSRPSSLSTSTTDAEDSLSVQLHDIVEAAAASVRRAAARLDVGALEKDWGIDLRGASLEGYETDLRRAYEDFFVPPHLATDSTHPLLDKILATVSFVPSDQSGRETIPKYIYTTDLLTPDKLPEQFGSWIKENPEWTTMFVSDKEIDEWLDRSFSPDQEDGEKEGEKGREREVVGVLRELRGLPKGSGVVRADLFRYLVLLLNGGIYTDTDTACVRPIRDWAANPTRPPADPLFAALPQLFHLARQAQGGDSYFDFSSTVTEGPPSLVVALEKDAPASGADWRAETFVRGLQVVQWTIMANKGHPVLLDVLGRALKTAREVREGKIAEPSVLDWTGPGVFTDAVFRYLLVRYGVHPQEISGIARPVRIGDVVIMPADSFRADASEGWQGEDKVVWHGFFGRWKGEK